MHDADSNLKSLDYSGKSQLRDQAGKGSPTQFDRMQGFIEHMQGQVNRINARVIDQDSILFGPSVKEAVSTSRPVEVPPLSPFCDGQVGQLSSALYRLSSDFRDLEASINLLLSRLEA